jgi:hypothetical protein
MDNEKETDPRQCNRRSFIRGAGALLGGAIIGSALGGSLLGGQGTARAAKSHLRTAEGEDPLLLQQFEPIDPSGITSHTIRARFDTSLDSGTVNSDNARLILGYSSAPCNLTHAVGNEIEIEPTSFQENETYIVFFPPSGLRSEDTTREYSGSVHYFKFNPGFVMEDEQFF